MTIRLDPVVLIVALLLASCSSGNGTDVNSAADTNTYSEFVPDETPMDADVEPYQGRYAWQGNLDGKYPVLMWYIKADSVLTGLLFYTEQKDTKPLFIVGEVKDGYHELKEYTPGGKITGFWRLKPMKYTIEGEWLSPVNDTRFSASLMKIDTPVTINSYEPNMEVSGDYRYSYGDDGGAGTLSVKQLKGNKIVVSFDNLTSGPAYNMATLKNDTLVLQGNKAIHHSTEFGECMFGIQFFTDFAVVKYIAEKADCGFGNRAGVDGVYIKAR